MMNTNNEFVNEESNASQCKRILEHLRNGHTITQAEAYDLYRCFRLSARIYDLKERGENIVSEMVVTPSGKRVAQYKMAV